MSILLTGPHSHFYIVDWASQSCLYCWLGLTVMSDWPCECHFYIVDWASQSCLTDRVNVISILLTGPHSHVWLTVWMSFLYCWLGLTVMSDWPCECHFYIVNWASQSCLTDRVNVISILLTGPHSHFYIVDWASQSCLTDRVNVISILLTGPHSHVWLTMWMSFHPYCAELVMLWTSNHNMIFDTYQMYPRQVWS